MLQTREKIASVLNELIETCKDGKHGFETAADGVENMDVKSLFRTYASQREQFISELRAEVVRLGEDPDKTGHLMAALHRAWIDIKSVVTSKDESAILAEAERGEDYAVEKYESALKEDLPMDVREVIQRQYARVREAHDKVRALRDITS